MLTSWKHGFSALMLCLLSVIGGASAADFTRQPGNGPWNDPNLWSPVGVPGASDNARIESTAGNITFTASATVGLLDVAGTYTGTIALGSYTLTTSQVSFAGGTFNGETGALVCNGSFAIAGGVFNAPPALTFKGNVTIPSGTFNHGNGAALFAANYQAAQTIAAGTAVFNQVTIKGNSISVTTIQDDLHVHGDLSFETTSYSGCTLNGGRILAKKNVTMSSSGVGTWDHPGNAWLVLCGAADQTLNGATSGRFTNIRIDKPSGILQLAGTPLVFGSWDWVNADGLNAGTSAVTFATPYNTVVSIKGGPVSYGDVTFKGWGQFSKHDLAGDLQIGGDLTLDVVAYSGNQVNGASFIVAGDVIMNNAGFGSASWGPGNSTIKLTGSGSHAIIANSSGHFPNMFIDTTGSVTTVGDVTVGGNWTFVNGTFTQGAGTLEFQAPYGATRTILPGTVSYGNVTITGNGLSNQSVAGTLHVAGKFILASAGYVGAKLNDGIVEVEGDFELPGDGFGASDGGPGSAVIRLAGTGNQTVTAGGLSRCPTLEIDASGTVTFVGGMRLGAHYLHTSGAVQAAGSTQTFVGRASTLITGAAVFGDLVIHKGPYGSAYSVTLEGAAQASGGLTVTEGILKFADNASLSVAGHVDVGAANVGITAGANSALTLNGSATQNVNLAGKTVFNLNVVNAAGAINFTAPYTALGTTSAVPGATLVFASGSTFNTGKLAMNGTQAQGIALRASTAGSAAGIVAAPYQFVRHAEITDLNAASGPKVVALHSIDGGNNQNIIFQAAALLNLAAGNTSVTSPAWVEGVSGPDVTSLTVALNGEAPFPASRLNPTQYYGSNQASGHALGIELSASAATTIEIAASNAFGESNTVTQNIAWAATDLAGKSYSTDQLKIRINSKLRFVLNNHDSNVGETVRIDTNNDGTFEYTGVEGESIEHLFNASGSVIVRGEIGGLAVGSMTVIVVDTNLHGPVACQKGYERGLDVFALPATEAASITYAAADPYALGLTVTQVTSDGALIKLKPTTMDSPYFVSRLGDASGPVIDIQPLMVFTVKDLNSHILGFAVDSTGYGRAVARYQITPRTVIDNDNPVTTAQEGLYFDLGCMGTDMVFAENGQSTLRVHSNRQDADGIFEVETLLAPTGTFVCHSIQPRQINSNYTVGDYLYHNPCVMKAAGGLYLHREMTDETTREGKTNLYADGHSEAGKQIFQVWDQDVEKDKRWTSEIVVAGFTPEQMEAAFFNTRARKKVLPNRHFTVKVEQPGNSYLFAVRMVPGTTGIKGGADIDDNTGVDRDEILYEREPNLPENYLQWTGGFPSAYPALNLPPNHWGHDYQDPSKQYKSWDGPFQRYSTSPWYTDIGFWKGNMIGKMTVWGTCHPAVGLTPRAHVLPNVRPGAPANPHTNSTFTSNDIRWGGEETEFRDILKFGRLEADGYLETDIPASGSGQSSTTADISSRNAFPDVVGANVFEVQKEIQVPDPNNPGQTMPKTETYLRTQHEGSTGTASPVPVQITFRAPPGQSVRVGVALARRAEKDDPQTPANEIDHDGKKTHRAWVHLSNAAIFESRGQPEDNEDVKAGKVAEILAFDAEGNITNEKPAERVVRFSMTANSEWFASQVVYVYGIEPSEKLDDLKLVVWGEETMDWKAYPKEVQTHHYQNNDKDPDCPIKRWYITDEEPMSVRRDTLSTAVQYLTPIEDNIAEGLVDKWSTVLVSQLRNAMPEELKPSPGQNLAAKVKVEVSFHDGPAFAGDDSEIELVTTELGKTGLDGLRQQENPNNYHVWMKLNGGLSETVADHLHFRIKSNFALNGVFGSDDYTETDVASRVFVNQTARKSIDIVDISGAIGAQRLVVLFKDIDKQIVLPLTLRELGEHPWEFEPAQESSGNNFAIELSNGLDPTQLDVIFVRMPNNALVGLVESAPNNADFVGEFEGLPIGLKFNRIELIPERRAVIACTPAGFGVAGKCDLFLESDVGSLRFNAVATPESGFGGLDLSGARLSRNEISRNIARTDAAGKIYSKVALRFPLNKTQGRSLAFEVQDTAYLQNLPAELPEADVQGQRDLFDWYLGKSGEPQKLPVVHRPLSEDGNTGKKIFLIGVHDKVEPAGGEGNPPPNPELEKREKFLTSKAAVTIYGDYQVDKTDLKGQLQILNNRDLQFSCMLAVNFGAVHGGLMSVSDEIQDLADMGKLVITGFATLVQKAVEYETKRIKKALRGETPLITLLVPPGAGLAVAAVEYVLSDDFKKLVNENIVKPILQIKDFVKQFADFVKKEIDTNGMQAVPNIFNALWPTFTDSLGGKFAVDLLGYKSDSIEYGIYGFSYLGGLIVGYAAATALIDVGEAVVTGGAALGKWVFKAAKFTDLAGDFAKFRSMMFKTKILKNVDGLPRQPKASAAFGLMGVGRVAETVKDEQKVKKLIVAFPEVEAHKLSGFVQLNSTNALPGEAIAESFEKFSRRLDAAVPAASDHFGEASLTLCRMSDVNEGRALGFGSADLIEEVGEGAGLLKRDHKRIKTELNLETKPVDSGVFGVHIDTGKKLDCP